MAEVTAAMIKELRERTGIGMGKCKEALEAANGNMELAIENLRKAGLATAVKKEGRATNEGMIVAAENGSTVAVLEGNAETDFVVRNEKFQQFLKNLAADAAKSAPASLEAFVQQKYSQEPGLTIDQYRSTLIQTIGENIQLRRVATFKRGGDKSIGVYSHMNGKILTLVEITGSDSEEALAKEIAMHTAAAAPEFLSPEKIPADVINKEKEIAKTQIKGKPENIIDKIVEGKINAFYDQVCLIRQKFIKDDSLSIEDLVSKRSKEVGKPLAVTNFIRWSVGQ